MFTHNSSVGKTRVWVSLVLVLSLVMGALSLAGCSLEDDDGFVDDHKLNSGLIGTWATEYSGYTITDTTIAYSDFGGWGGDFTGTIRYIYNFSETAGVVIVEYITADPDFTGSPDPNYAEKYDAVYFNSLTTSTVKLGVAYDTSVVYGSGSMAAAVSTLDLAKERFKPANISLWGGDLGATYPKQ
ncbi:hypothetical protein AGMMS49944_30450 [Spirochaetia bacterium]|nr:hypothetical protein AGMMS49944_30450 [Spirochaetia bacterium]